MKRGGGLHLARPDCWPPTKRPRATPEGLIAAGVTCLSRREGVPPDFLAYPVPNACMHVRGTRVPRRLGVARSASSPKAAQALGCSLTPWSPDLVLLGHLHGTGCLSARALGTGFPTVVRRLCFRPGCGSVWVLLTPPVLAGVLGGCVWAWFVVSSLFCRLFVVFVVGLRFWPAYGTCVVSCALCLPPAVSASDLRCGRACTAQVSAVPRSSSRGVFFALFFSFLWLCGVGCWVSLSQALWSLSPHPLSLGWAAGFFFSVVCVCMFRCPISRWAAVPGLVLPVLAGWSPCASLGVLSFCLWCLLGRGFGRLLWCWRAVRLLWAVLAPPPLPPLFFFFGGGGAACSSLRLPWAGARNGPHSVWSSGLLLAVAFCFAVFRPQGSGGLCTRWARCPFLSG